MNGDFARGFVLGHVISALPAAAYCASTRTTGGYVVAVELTIAWVLSVVALRHPRGAR